LTFFVYLSKNNATHQESVKMAFLEEEKKFLEKQNMILKKP